MSILKNLLGYNSREDKGVGAVLEGQASLSVETRHITRWGMVLLLVGVGGFLLWGVTAPLSQGAPVAGFIKVEGNSKAVQHLHGGIVQEILIKEGDAVVQNQPLIRLNTTQLKSEFGAVDSDLVSSLAVEARLVAERSGAESIKYPEFLLEHPDQSKVREVIAVQSQLFHTRRTVLSNEQSIARETISGIEQQIHGFDAQEVARASQMKIFTDELASLRPLYDEGFIPRTRIFELERAIAYLSGQRSENLAAIGRAKSQISEIKLRILQSTQTYQKEVETQLTDIQRHVSDLKEKYTATRDELDRAIIRAPISGVIFGLNINTEGGVINSGQKLMDILPEGSALLIEAHIPTNLIDNVETGLDADINFPALDKFEVSHIHGRLIYISADRFTDQKTDMPYYLGRVEVTPEGMKALGIHKIRAGMPANVVIVTGERTMFSYLVRPLAARLHFAFTEK